METSKKIANVIRRNPFLKLAVKSIYKLIMFPFTRRGIDVNIGGMGLYKLDYHFAFSEYEGFGNRHNAGFKKWIECCRNKAAVFDIGAHIGLYALPASKAIASDGVVHAFEPSEANRRYLAQHLKYNDIRNVRILPYIVGEKAEKEQVFYEKRIVDPMSSLHPKKNINLYPEVYREQITLDDFTKRFNVDPDVIKVDVEGSECNVLKGACEFIKRHRPIIFLSIHPNQLSLFKSSVNELRNIIESLGYVIQDWEGKEVTEFKHQEYILRPI